jgi:aldehyde:ferredoxin oxidoreductase
MYGGPEYEAIAGFGSNLGINDLEALAYANMRCTALGMDTISASGTIAFAIECFEHGVITEEDTSGMPIIFGNAKAMLWLLEHIGKRKEIGNLLAEGVRRAAEMIGDGADQFALHVKSQELPLHDPRFKQGMGLGYAVSPTGADHEHNIHDTDFIKETNSLQRMRSFDDFEPMKLDDLSSQKIKLFTYHTNWQHLIDCLVMCRFLPYNVDQITDLVKGVTGCNVDKWELLKVGERAATLSKIYNLREGIDKDQDRLPDRFFSPFNKGPLSGVAIDRSSFQNARDQYYQLMGWDINGRPTKSKIRDLSLDDLNLKLS